MRPIVDLNNLSYSDETRVYYSRFNIICRFIIFIIIFIYCCYIFINESFLFGILLLMVLLFLIKSSMKFIKERNVVLLRINSEGVSVRNDDLISWDEIENERIDEVRTGDYDVEHDFIFYDKKNNRQVKFRVEELNIGVHEIVKSFEIHRGRFNRRNLNQQ